MTAAALLLLGPSAVSPPEHGTAPVRITEQQAIARAVNDLTATHDGVSLRHPRHRAEFTREGIRFVPRGGGPAWRWHLSGAAPVRPERDGNLIVYRREALVERYLPGAESVEQQFVLARRPAARGDFVLSGRIEAAGKFGRTHEGWTWSTKSGAVTLGDVAVHDDRGRRLPATMSVTSSSTRISVDGTALATADYPVTVDPEIGTNDFQISAMGPPDTKADAREPVVAYNSTNNEYLVVWHGDDNSTPLVDGELEIYGQRIDAATGAELGANDFRISDMGPDGNASYEGSNAAVAYNSTNNEYLVVWNGDDNTAPLVDEEAEIFGQRLTAGGSEILPNDFRISDAGPNGDPSYGAFLPDIAYNSASNEYLVVWEGDDDLGVLVDNEYEIFGQRLNASSGAALGTNDFRISDMGLNGNTGFVAFYPAVAYNGTNNEYLVAWDGDDNTAPLVDNETEVFGQRLSTAGAELGTNDFRMSDMGPNGDSNYGAFFPDIAYNGTDNEYLVVWEGDDNTAPLVGNEFEIFGQRLTGSSGAELGTNDFRISDMGPDGNTTFIAQIPAVAYNSTDDEYVVIWSGDDVANELEAFGQRLSAVGAELGTNDFRLSDMGPDGVTGYGAVSSGVVHNATNNEYLVVWWGEDNTVPLVAGESEIFSQRVNAASGAELGTNDFRLSDMGPVDTVADAFDPAAAYNGTNNEYLVVWWGDDNTAPLADDEFEIFGQRLNASTGNAIGSDFRISDLGPDGNANYDAFIPGVAYNATSNEYLVVWEGDDNTAPLVDGEFEIFGQRLTATGSEIVPNDFRISDLGSDGSVGFAARAPAVAYDGTNDEYLVVWYGDDNTGSLVDNEFEIFGQRITASTGAETGTNDFRISDLGPNGDATFDAMRPAVAYDGTDNEYLVVWDGDDSTAPLVNGESEIFGQRLNASSGAALGSNDFRISDLGPTGNVSYGGVAADVAYNAADNEYLVVWYGDDNTAPLVDGEFEIFGQRLNNVGGALGANDFRISDAGPNGNTTYGALSPAVSYNGTNDEYLVVWYGDDNTAPLVAGELEIFGQRLTAATGAETGTNDFRLSDLGPNANTSYGAGPPDAAYSATSKEYLVVWHGDDNTTPLVDNELEVFGQRFAPDAPTAVTVFSFTSRAMRAGIRLSWRTGSEAGLLGFDVRRDGRRLTSRPIAAGGGARGATYTYVDRTARHGTSHRYQLEAVFLDGSRRVVARSSIPFHG